MSTYQISQSSLLSLKAEILRKQQELVEAKAENKIKREIIKKKTPLELKNKGVENRKRFDDTEEEKDLLKQSSIALQQKAKIYDELLSGKLNPADHSRFLVCFDRKDGSDLPPDEPDDEPDKTEDSTEEFYDSDGDVDPSEKWVTYTDCLGRTRKCLAKDLEHIKRSDEKLKKVVEKKQMQDKQDQGIKTAIEATEKNEDEVEEEKPLPEMLSDQMRNEILRRQWEKDEERIRNKADVHYQDVLFGEARSHGVGYYGFSTDEDERLRQQEALKKLRKETEEKQAEAKRLRELRDQQLAARIKAAKERKRIRLGLPPEEDEPPEPSKPEENEEEKKKREEEEKEREAAEKILEELRKKHVRPWDIGKEGVKVFEEMSQDEWVEKKRDERVEEFAPPQTYKRENFRSAVKKEAPTNEDMNKGLKFSTVKYRREKNMQKKMFNRNEKDKKVDKDEDRQPDVNDPNFKQISQAETVSSTRIQDEDCGDFDDALLSDYRKAISKVTCTLFRTDDENNKTQSVIETKKTTMEEDCGDFDDALLTDYRKAMNKVTCTIVRHHDEDNQIQSATEPKTTRISDDSDNNDVEDALLADYNQSMENPKPSEHSFGVSPPPFFKRGNDRGDFEDALSVHPKKALPNTYRNKRRFGESPPPFFKRGNDRKDFEDALMSSRKVPRYSRNVEVPLDDVEDHRVSSQSDKGRRGVEVPPPPTFDYYGPSGGGANGKGMKAVGVDIEKSIEAGLKLLRKQVEEKEKSKGRPDEMFLL
nr:unnamed protein product [Callosobruchus analis]